jgi:predicted amidohydrolase YtcJ
VVVDEFAKVKDLADQSGLTQSLAHVQLVHPDDQKRIGELGISSVFTFVWTAGGMEYEMMVAPFIDQLDGVEDLYNPDHYYMQNVYPAKSMQDFGGVIVNGSDAPVGSRNPMPLVSLQHAITRGNDGVALNPKESIDIHSAIAAFTINGAKLFGHEEQVGSIQAGKIADIIVLNQNIIALADAGHPERIGETQVTMTVFDGKIVFEQPN